MTTETEPEQSEDRPDISSQQRFIRMMERASAGDLDIIDPRGITPLLLFSALHRHGGDEPGPCLLTLEGMAHAVDSPPGTKVRARFELPLERGLAVLLDVIRRFSQLDEEAVASLLSEMKAISEPVVVH